MAPTEVTFFQSCTSVTFLLGVPANMAVLIYLICGSKDHCKITLNLFRFIVTTDLLFSITVSPFSIQQITGIALYSPKNQVFCEVFEFTFNALSRIIYFWMSLLAVVRARAIRNPLSQLTELAIRCIMIGTTSFFVLLSLIPLILRQTNEDAFCGGRLENTFKNKLGRTLWVGLGTLLPVGLSVIVMLSANVVSLYCLLVKGGRDLASRQSCKTKKAAAKTTLMLTTIFFCLHITGVIKSWSQMLGKDIGIPGAYANGLMILSAAVDPFVYFLKTPAVWTYWKRVIIMRKFSRLKRFSYKRFQYERTQTQLTMRTVTMKTERTLSHDCTSSHDLNDISNEVETIHNNHTHGD